MKKETSKYKEYGKRACRAVITSVMMAPVTVQTFLAAETEGGGEDIFSRAENLMNTFYGDVAGIATVAAGVCAAVCFLMLIFSKNQRAVDESRSWLKRIAICWLGIMLINAIIAYLTSNLGIAAPDRIIG